MKILKMKIIILKLIKKLKKKKLLKVNHQFLKKK